MWKSRECIFIEKLLEYCLEEYDDIVWTLEAKNGQAQDTDPLFNATIGNKVMNTSIQFQSKVQEYSTVIWNVLVCLPDPVEFQIIYSILNVVSLEIYRSDSVMESTYIFLAVMVDVSHQCYICEQHYLIEAFVCIIPDILNIRLPNKFIPDFDKFLKYAQLQAQPPVN